MSDGGGIVGKKMVVGQTEGPAWPEDASIVLVVTDGGGYQGALSLAVRAMTDRAGGVVVTANRPARTLRAQFEDAGIPLRDVTFVDCISGLTGVAPPDEPDVMHVESPTMLEKIALRAERALANLPEDRRFLVVDSLSTLAVYNGPDAVAEVTHNLITRLRMLDARAALLLVEKQADPGLLGAVEPLCDGTLRA